MCLILKTLTLRGKICHDKKLKSSILLQLTLIPISKKSMPALKKKEQREVGKGRPKIPTILMKKIPMRRKILIKRKKKPERKANGNGSPKIQIPRILKQILMKNPMRCVFPVHEIVRDFSRQNTEVQVLDSII